MIRRRVLIAGKVQGVGFRASTLQRVQEVGPLKGYVKNLPDGGVEAVFQGAEDAVLRMIEWCHHGPQNAKVVRVEILEEKPDPSASWFELRH